VGCTRRSWLAGIVRLIGIGVAMETEFTFLTGKQVCEMLKIGRTKLWYSTKEGHRYFDSTAPRWHRVGRRGRRWRLNEVLAWAKANCIAVEVQP